MRAFLADPVHGAGQFRLIPVMRARVTGVERPRNEPRELRGRPRSRIARLANTPSPTGIELEANEKCIERRVLEWPVRRARSVD